MYQTYKIQLCPNEFQEKRLFLYSHTARFSYNWALERLYHHYNTNHRFLQDGELRKLFTQFKQLPENQWLYSISNNVPKQAIKDACSDFNNFIFHAGKKPRFKQRNHTKPSFHQDGEKIFFSSTHVKLEKIGSKNDGTFHQNLILLAEHNRIPSNAKYINPHIYYDGLKWWLTVAIPTTYSHSINPAFRLPQSPPPFVAPASYGLGIDLGVTNYATLSDGTYYASINQTPKVIFLEKRKRRLYKSLLRKYSNSNIPPLHFHHDKYAIANPKSNLLKNERELISIQNKLYNIRINYINHLIKEILSRDPLFIVIEDLAVTKLMEDPTLNFAIRNQYFHYFRKKLRQKCHAHHIPFFIANRYFPSTQKCCVCGRLNNLPDLSTRIYRCLCGNIIDRDLQAAINLRNHLYEFANSEFKPTDYT